jgi:hypothetical protein
MTGLSQWAYIAAAAATGIIFAVLSYFNQREGRDVFAAILAAGAIIFSVLCVGMAIWG